MIIRLKTVIRNTFLLTRPALAPAAEFGRESWQDSLDDPTDHSSVRVDVLISCALLARLPHLPHKWPFVPKKL